MRLFKKLHQMDIVLLEDFKNIQLDDVINSLQSEILPNNTFYSDFAPSNASILVEPQLAMTC